MGNDKWFADFPDASVPFVPERTFDHFPAILAFEGQKSFGRKPFRYYNMWSLDPYSKQRIEESWVGQVHGVPMFTVVQKLKRLKKVFRNIDKEKFSDIEKEEQKCLQELKSCQDHMHRDPRNTKWADKELVATERYRLTHKAYVSFIQQKSKAHRLREGDQNT